MQKAWGDEKCIQLWSENLKERDHLEDEGEDGRKIWIFKKYDGVWIGLSRGQEPVA
jgi:hypothetical protein